MMATGACVTSHHPPGTDMDSRRINQICKAGVDGHQPAPSHMASEMGGRYLEPPTDDRLQPVGANNGFTRNAPAIMQGYR